MNRITDRKPFPNNLLNSSVRSSIITANLLLVKGEKIVNVNPSSKIIWHSINTEKFSNFYLLWERREFDWSLSRVYQLVNITERNSSSPVNFLNCLYFCYYFFSNSILLNSFSPSTPFGRWFFYINFFRTQREIFWIFFLLKFGFIFISSKCSMWTWRGRSEWLEIALQLQIVVA